MKVSPSRQTTQQTGFATYKAMKLNASTVCTNAPAEVWLHSEAVKTTTTSHKYEKMMLNSSTYPGYVPRMKESKKNATVRTACDGNPGQ